MTYFEKMEANAPAIDHPDAGRYWRAVCQRLFEHGRPSLTENMAKALKFIVAYTDEHGYSPAYRDIGDHIGIAAAGVGYLVRGLAERGYVHKILARKRSITVIEFPQQNNIDL